jgi:hypothetical protein
MQIHQKQLPLSSLTNCPHSAASPLKILKIHRIRRAVASEKQVKGFEHPFKC